ncbi:unnamed protein product [Caenorhabditis nigoni]
MSRSSSPGNEWSIGHENDRVLAAAHRKLDRFSEAFDCKCTNGCTKDCPCAVLDKVFYTGSLLQGQPPVTDRVDALSTDYEKSLKAVIESGVSLNPRNKSSEGRFASSSCLGNTKVNFVHKRGVSPTNARIIFTALMPIFPTQDIEEII